MEKISIKNLIDFRRKSERSKKTYVNNLKKEKKPDSSGGDYWISCLSTISNVFKTENTDLWGEKIKILEEKIDFSEDQRTKSMFQRNIDILHNFQDFEIETIKPNGVLEFHKKPDSISIIKINGLPIQAKPHHVFSFPNDGNIEIGAVWFIAKLNGYNKGELGMFVDILYRYLNKNFSESYSVNPSYCIAIDVFNGYGIDYSDILKGEIPILIDKTINELNSLR